MKLWSWRQAILKSELQATTKLVLLVLSTYMNDHGEGCYPSQEQIAASASLTARAVIKHIDLAINAGFLVKNKRNKTGKLWDSNEYSATIPCGYTGVVTQNVVVNHVHPTAETLAFEDGSILDNDKMEGVNHVHPTAENLDSGSEPRSPLDGSWGEPRSLEGCTTFTSGVNHVHTNYPENYSKKEEEEKGAQGSLADELSAAAEIIKNFNEVFQEVFGSPRQGSRIDDLPAAENFLAAGASPDFCREVFRRKFWQLKQNSKTIPAALVYFKQIIPDELARGVKKQAPAAKKQAEPPPELSAQERAKRIKTKRKFGVFLDTAQENFLNDFERLNGEVVI